MLDKLKDMPEEERQKKAGIIKEVISIILYFVILNNPGKSVLIKLAMRIFGISEENFKEYDDALNEIDPPDDQPKDVAA